jgi:hypothetical protein
MELAQIKRFIEESVVSDHHWKQIRLLGGEPTLHPQFFEIIDTLLTWRDSISPDTRIELATNGYGKKVEAVLAKLPPGIEVDNTGKTSQIQPFKSFNVAPVDQPEYSKADFTNGCRVIKVSGMALNPYGWYPCAVAGSIDRIFGYNLGYKQLPDNEDDMLELLNVFCRLCGLFKRRYEAPLDHPVQSITWEKAYSRYRDKPPTMSRY